MRFILPVLALTFLLTGLTRFGGRVRAQTPAGTSETRLVVEGNRLIRIEPSALPAPTSRRVMRTPDQDAQPTASRSGPVLRLDDVIPEAAGPRAPAAGGRMRQPDPEQQIPRTGPRVVRVPSPDAK